MMTSLKLSENIIELRHAKGVTQDELASFLGVTKASVSKWETKQSMPDILLLPQIATYFDISIDELMGYEPQLSPQQIRKCYQDMAKNFVTLPFEEALTISRELVKKYYSCYSFLMQVALLWLNHFMLAEDKKGQNKILNDIMGICDHISEGCSELQICSDAVILRAMVNLQLGNAEEVIETLSPILNPKSLKDQADSLLIHAYQMSGNLNRADYHSQIVTYTSLIKLIMDSFSLISLHMNDKEFCEKTILRIRKIIEAYNIEDLHPNLAAQFHYQSALFYSMHGEEEELLDELKLFVAQSLKIFDSNNVLHGDDYFNRLDEWFSEFTLGTDLPRSRKLVLDSALQGLLNPIFSKVADKDEYKILKREIERRRN